MLPNFSLCQGKLCLAPFILPRILLFQLGLLSFKVWTLLFEYSTRLP